MTLDEPKQNPHDLEGRAKAAAERLLRQRATRRGANERVFEDDRLVAGRYRVLRLLERGGAGQVYKVLDEELERHIALKALHPGIAASPKAARRFKQELLLAREVTHVNVCRLYELGRDETTADDGRPGDKPGENPGAPLFLTMELIEGESLAEVAESCAPLPTREIVELGRQIALGLGAAHQKGVIHGDLKAQNVLLQDLPDGARRAVLTDFGLATLVSPSSDPAGNGHKSSPGDLEAPVESSHDRALVGTPLTMAPEQVRGDGITPKTDIYSFGVLLYHLATGAWPFNGPTPLNIAVRRLETLPEPPRRHRPSLPRNLESLILKCLEPRPADRPQSMEEILGRLDDPRLLDADADQVTGSTTKRSGNPLKIRWAALAVVLLLTAPLCFRRSPTPSSSLSPLAEAIQERPAVLWLGLRGLPSSQDDDSAWLATLVEKGIEAYLSAGGELRLVAGEKAAEIRRELDAAGLESLDPLDAPRLRQLKRRADVDHVLYGRAETVGNGELRFEIYPPGSSKDVPDLGGLVSAEDLADLTDQVSAVSERLRTRLALERSTDEQRSAARAEIPSHPEAARLYMEGLDALNRYQTQNAADLLRQSLNQEPNHPKVLATLSTVWMTLGRGDRAKQASRLAFEHAHSLSRAQQMGIEALYRLRHREWQRAASIFSALWEFFPDEAEYGLGLVEALDRGGEVERALEALETLRSRLPGSIPSPRMARFHLTESMLAYHQGDYERSERTARLARQIGESIEAPAVVAEAMVQESLTRIVTDADLAAVEDTLRQAIEMLEHLGESQSLVRAQLYLADCAKRADRFEVAEAAYRRTIDTATAIGKVADRDRARTSLAILLDGQGQLRDGLILKQQVLQSYRERNVVQGAVIAQENVAISLLKMGRTTAALEELADVERRYQELGDRIGMAWSPYYQGRAWLDRGELTLAERHLARAQGAIDASPQAIPGNLAGAVDYERARLALLQRRLDVARNLAEPLIPLHESIDQPFGVAESRLLVARIDRLQGRFQQATEQAEAALAHFRATGVAHEVLAARTELAEIELANINPEASAPSPTHSMKEGPARLRFQETSEILVSKPGAACNDLATVPMLEHRRVVLLASVVATTCRYAAQAPKIQVLEELEPIISEARDLELFLPELRARLLKSRALRDLNRRQAAQAEIQTLAQMAQERGFNRSTVTDARYE